MKRSRLIRRRNERTNMVALASSVLIIVVVVILTVLLALAAKLHTSTRQKKDSPAYVAFDEWARGIGMEDIKDAELVRFSEVPEYGRIVDTDYTQHVEYALLCEDLVDFAGRSQQRREWAYRSEKSLFDELVSKAVKTAEDSVLINKSVLRMKAYSDMLGEEIGADRLASLVDNRAAAYGILDSLNAIRGLRLEYEVRKKSGEKYRFSFLSPADTIILNLIDAEELR